MALEVCKEELAYLAGFFDGEGTLFQAKRKGRKLGTWDCSVANVDKEVLEYFQKTFRMGRLYSHKRQKSNYQECWIWKITTRANVLKLLRLLLPFIKTNKNITRFKKAIEDLEERDWRHSKWSFTELLYLKKNYLRKSDEDLAIGLRRGRRGIQNKRLQLKLYRKVEGRDEKGRYFIKGHTLTKGKNNPMYNIHRFAKDNPMFGKSHTPEAKGKMREAHAKRRLKNINIYLA